MIRVKLTVAYDGTNYCGWQIQPNGITVEEVLNRELTNLLGESIKVIGASRTDSGVHAFGNVAVFDTNTKIPPDKIAFALNQRLPEDIKIQGSCQTADDFHPRFCKSCKTYEYRILNRTFNIPQFRLYTHFVHYNLDIGKMKRASKYLIGKHDFKSFCTAKPEVTDTVREIYDIKITEEDGIIIIRVEGAGFLYNMVRIIAGTLINTGMGSIAPDSMEGILRGRDRSLAGPTAPAKGLVLVKIDYPQVV